jgi:hypothetical protein
MKERIQTSVLRITLIAAVSALLFGLHTAGQSVPSLINYQGRLTGQTGSPLAGGYYVIQFRLWNDPTASSPANLIWSQQQSVIVQTNGIFDVLLGSPGGSAISGEYPAVANIASAFASSNAFLGVTLISSNGVSVFGPSEILPRQQLLSVPFAVQAQMAQVASTLVTSTDYDLRPPGSVVAYMGNALPPGWLLCDGSAVSRMQYPDLFLVLGTSSGPGDGSATFNLPDMRGMFLRGVLGSQTNVFPGTANMFDPDVLTRTNIVAGGNVGNAVGSIEADQLRTHSHGLPMGTGSPWDDCCNEQPDILPDIAAQTSPAGGNETRPVNAYVNYIIKY